MRVIVDLNDLLDGDLVIYDSFNGTPEEVCDQIAKLHIPDEVIDQIDAGCSSLSGELPGATVTVDHPRYNYSAEIRRV